MPFTGTPAVVTPHSPAPGTCRWGVEKEVLGSSPGWLGQLSDLSELHLPWVVRDSRYKPVYLLHVSVANCGTDSVHQVFVTTPWHTPSAPKSFVPSPSYPEPSCWGWKPNHCFGGTTHKGALHPPKAEWAWSPSWRSSLGEFGGLQGGVAESSLSLHSNPSHTAWGTPRSQLPQKELADVRTGLHLHLNLRTFLQGVGVLLTAQGHRVPSAHLGSSPAGSDGQMCESPLACCMMLLTGYFGNYDSTCMYKIRWF